LTPAKGYCDILRDVIVPWMISRVEEALKRDRGCSHLAV